MKYLVIGLGNLGRAIAENLSQIGHEVIGVDRDMHRVDNLKETLSGAICLDTTDKVALQTLPLTEMNAVFVTYGKDFGTSIQTVALLKSLHVNKLIVRSISEIHETVIQAIGVSEIMQPEQDYASFYATQSILGDLFQEWFRITETHHIYKMTVPKALIGQKVANIKFEENFSIRLAGIERPFETRNLVGIKQTDYQVLDTLNGETVIMPDDRLILFGKLEVMRKLVEI